MNAKSGLHILVILFALITSVLAAIANILISNWFSINIFSFGFWVIIPVGAVLIGAVGASGGYLACQYFNVRPNLFDLIALVLVAVLTMFLIYFLDYQTLVLDNGVKAADVVDFGTYIDVVITKSHMRVGRGMTDTGEVGGLGYGLLAIRFVGVLVGGLIVFFALKALDLCETCNVYYKKIATKSTLHASAEHGQAMYEKMHTGLTDDYKEAMSTTVKGDAAVMIKYTLMRCPSCSDEFINEEFSVKTDNKDWTEVASLKGKTRVPNTSNFELEFKK